MRSYRPSPTASRGMVATSHYLASEAGAEVLRDGGSAMDAAIAANAVLTVIYPDQTAIGGDCFFIHHDGPTGEIATYNGSGAAPRSAEAGHLRASGYERMPAKGGLPVTVPGTIDAWFAGHERFGRVGLDRILDPAIGFARDGYPVSPRLGSVLAAQRDLISAWPGLASIVRPGGRIPLAGDMLANPDLATALETIAAEGRDGFYGGAIAAEIVDTVQNAGGSITADDLADHEGEWVDAVERTFQGRRILTAPPNSQGMTVLMALGLLDVEGLGSDAGRQALAADRAYGVRNERLGDPRFIDIDTDELLSDDFLRGLSRSGGEPGARHPRADGDTVYLCTADEDGNAVSLIQSLFGVFGSCVVAAGTGIILQNRGSYFSLSDGHPNELIGGKRTLHTLMPSMLMEGDRLVGTFGTQGGDPQAQIQLQLLIHLIENGLEPQEAIDAPRWIVEDAGYGGGSVLVESAMAEREIAALHAAGYGVTIIDPWNPGAGHAQMILRDEERGVWTGGADPRADGSAVPW